MAVCDSSSGEAPELVSWKHDALSLVASAVPAASSAVTRTSHSVPASVSGVLVGCVLHVSVPSVLDVLSTVHVASNAPPLRSSTPMRAAASPKPSPDSVSTTPPAALPEAVPPPLVVVATVLRLSTPATVEVVHEAAA